MENPPKCTALHTAQASSCAARRHQSPCAPLGAPQEPHGPARDATAHALRERRGWIQACYEGFAEPLFVPAFFSAVAGDAVSLLRPALFVCRPTGALPELCAPCCSKLFPDVAHSGAATADLSPPASPKRAVFRCGFVELEIERRRDAPLAIAFVAGAARAGAP